MARSNSYFMAHIALLGDEAHAALARGNVLVIGAGGLGCAALAYLARCGLARIGICDGDRVEEHNLQRQTLFTTSDVGRNKAEAAKEKLADLCPTASYPFAADENTIGDLIAAYDVILDCTDTFEAKFLINDACVTAGKPMVFGNALQWQGMCTTFCGKPCLACVFHHVPKSVACSDAGVLNALVGVIGAMQAAEALRLLAGRAGLEGKLFVYDAAKGSARTVTYAANAHCPTCSSSHKKSDHQKREMGHSTDAPCGGSEHEEIDATELRKMLTTRSPVMLIDVREPWERAQGAIEPSLHIPLRSLPARLHELDPKFFYVVYCAHGNRSLYAAALLTRRGFSAASLADGFAGWITNSSA